MPVQRQQGIAPVTLVFVHLGTSVPPILNVSAHHALTYYPSATLALITDTPEMHRGFPGKVIKYSRDSHDAWLGQLEKRFPEKALDTGGYWIKTLERLFALSAVQELNISGPILQIESDVFCAATPEIVGALAIRYSTPALPRLSEHLACPSIIFFPDESSLQLTLHGLRGLAEMRSGWFTDMELLSEAVIGGLMEELPTTPENALETQGRNSQDIYFGSSRRVIFDALAIGQYLFGQNPFHTEGRRVSGHIWPDFPDDIQEWRWRIATGDPATLVADTTSGPIEIANVHVHAKIDPGSLGPSASSAWSKAIAEANGTQFRTDGNEPFLGLQRSPAPPIARLRSWKSEGWPRIRASLRYRLRQVFPPSSGC
jgi:hypothetical protein